MLAVLTPSLSKIYSVVPLWYSSDNFLTIASKLCSSASANIACTLQMLAGNLESQLKYKLMTRFLASLIRVSSQNIFTGLILTFAIADYYVLDFSQNLPSHEMNMNLVLLGYMLQIILN